MYAFVADRTLHTAVQNYRKSHGKSESDALRDLLRMGLEAQERDKKILAGLRAHEERFIKAQQGVPA